MFCNAFMSSVNHCPNFNKKKNLCPDFSATGTLSLLCACYAHLKLYNPVLDLNFNIRSSPYAADISYCRSDGFRLLAGEKNQMTELTSFLEVPVLGLLLSSCATICLLRSLTLVLILSVLFLKLYSHFPTFI